MMKNKTRIEQYIKTRLWNSKIKGQKVSQNKLLSELNLYYQVNVNEPDTQNYLRKCISRIRRNTNKRYSLLNQNLKDWSKILGVEEDLMRKWWEDGVITNKRSVERIGVVLKDVKNCPKIVLKN